MDGKIPMMDGYISSEHPVNNQAAVTKMEAKYLGRDGVADRHKYEFTFSLVVSLKATENPYRWVSDKLSWVFIGMPFKPIDPQGEDEAVHE